VLTKLKHLFGGWWIAGVLRAVAKFIVPYWGTKSTIAYGWRTDPPAYVAYAVVNCIPQSRTMNWASELQIQRITAQTAQLQLRFSWPMANEWEVAFFWPTAISHQNVVKHWWKWYWKKGATLGQVREGTKKIASDRVEGWVGDGILGRELICDILYFKVSLHKPTPPT
jgi:hypothetical protein